MRRYRLGMRVASWRSSSIVEWVEEGMRERIKTQHETAEMGCAFLWLICYAGREDPETEGVL